MRDRWEELRTLLEPGKFWQSHDRFKAIRLLGRQPLDADEDKWVAEVFVASHALNPGKVSRLLRHPERHGAVVSRPVSQDHHRAVARA